MISTATVHAHVLTLSIQLSAFAAYPSSITSVRFRLRPPSIQLRTAYSPLATCQLLSTSGGPPAPPCTGSAESVTPFSGLRPSRSAVCIRRLRRRAQSTRRPSPNQARRSRSRRTGRRSAARRQLRMEGDDVSQKLGVGGEESRRQNERERRRSGEHGARGVRARLGSRLIGNWARARAARRGTMAVTTMQRILRTDRALACEVS